MRRLKFAAPVALVFALAACEGVGPKQAGGTLVGAGLGALAGSKIGKGKGKLAAVAAGALAGAVLGGEVGKSLDRVDRMYAQRTSQKALEKNKSGQASVWRNPDSGNSGVVRPVRTFKTAAGKYCREYQQTVTIAGKTESAYGTACRQPDGSWKVVN